MGSSNPKSVRYTPLADGQSEGRAQRRKLAIDKAVEATTDQAGLDGGDEAKAAVKRSQK